MILNATTLGEGPDLVLVHGLFGQSGNFATMQKRLAVGRRVTAVDLRNHGVSPHAASMDFRDMAADLLETLAALGVTRCDLMGHSMGGKVVMATALTAPDLVRRLIVSDIAPVRYNVASAALARALLALPLTPGLTRAQADMLLAQTVDLPSLRAFLLSNLRFGSMPAWRIGLAEISAAMDQIGDWPDFGTARFTCPTLIVAGGKSEYIQPEHRAIFRALFPAARFVTIKNAGHWVHADEPDAFLQLMQTALPLA